MVVVGWSGSKQVGNQAREGGLCHRWGLGPWFVDKSLLPPVATEPARTPGCREAGSRFPSSAQSHTAIG